MKKKDMEKLGEDAIKYREVKHMVRMTIHIILLVAVIIGAMVFVYALLIELLSVYTLYSGLNNYRTAISLKIIMLMAGVGIVLTTIGLFQMVKDIGNSIEEETKKYNQSKRGDKKHG